MYRCELCGKQFIGEGYMIVDLKLKKVWIVCYKCGESMKLDKKIK